MDYEAYYKEIDEKYGPDLYVGNLSINCQLADNNVPVEMKPSVVEEIEKWRNSREGWSYWSTFSELSKTATDPGLKAVWKRLSSYCYHMEEASCGML